MRKLLRKLGGLVFLACVTTGLVAGARALKGRLSADPGSRNRMWTGSYDSWPPVPSAPGRKAGAG
jgi:hypothetical protein